MENETNNGIEKDTENEQMQISMASEKVLIKNY